nr:hypothetical protein [Pandoravirus aubagnensis]
MLGQVVFAGARRSRSFFLRSRCWPFPLRPVGQTTAVITHVFFSFFLVVGLAPEIGTDAAGNSLALVWKKIMALAAQTHGRTNQRTISPCVGCAKKKENQRARTDECLHFSILDHCRQHRARHTPRDNTKPYRHRIHPRRRLL